MTFLSVEEGDLRYPRKFDAVTVEELFQSTVIPAWISGPNVTNRIPNAFIATLFSAPYPLQVLAVELSFDYFNLAASDASYWGFNVRASGAVITTATTRASGPGANGGITARRSWNFDAQPFNPTTARLDKGDTVELNPYPLGGAPPLVLPVAVTVRYAPV